MQQVFQVHGVHISIRKVRTIISSLPGHMLTFSQLQFQVAQSYLSDLKQQVLTT